MKLLYTLFLLICTMAASAQEITPEELQETKEQLKQNIKDMQRQLDLINKKTERPYYYMNDTDGWGTKKRKPSAVAIDRRDLDELYDDPVIFTPGSALKKAAQSQFLGLGIGMLSGLTGTLLLSEGELAGIYIAGLSGVAAIIFGIKAWSHISKAGKLMDGDRLALRGNSLTLNISR